MINQQNGCMPSDIVDQHVYSCNLGIKFNICISDILNQYVLLAKANTHYSRFGVTMDIVINE